MPRRASARDGARTRAAAARAALVVACAALRATPARGYPYYNPRACGDAAHPTGWAGDHPYAGDDAGVSFSLFWSAHDGSNETQAWELWDNSTRRLMPSSWATSATGDEYKPEARLTLVVDTSAIAAGGGVGMVLLTTSEGRFEDVSMHEAHVSENGGSRSALRCGGKRVNPSLRTNKHKLIWWAPARGTGDVVIRATTASAAENALYQGTFTVRENDGLQPPSANGTNASDVAPAHDDTTEVGDSSVGSEDEARQVRAFVVHGGMMFTGIWMLMPGAVGWSRFGRPGPNDKPSAAWLSWHKWLMLAAVALVVIAAGISYAEISEIGATHYDDAHGKVGLAIVVVACLQPVGGFLRPPNPPEGELKSQARRTWERVHRAVGVLIFILSFFAVLSGIDELSERDESVAARFHSVLFVLYVFVLFAFFAYASRHRAAASVSRAAFVELSSFDNPFADDADVDDDRASLAPRGFAPSDA